MTAKNQPSANALYRAAQEFIRDGQPVFPCRSRGEKAKRPMTKNGFKDATLDRSVAKSWWSASGTAGIGIPTGILWDVLDVDTKNGSDGRGHLIRLKELGLLNGCKKLVRTPSGGWHLYFKTNPAGMTNKAKSAALGLDVRGRGGYVLAAPSYIITPDYAGAYEELAEPENSTDDVLLWDLIVNCLAPVSTQTRQEIELPPADKQWSLPALRSWLSKQPHGNRNPGLFWAVCRCIENGMDPNELIDAALLTGLGEEEILTTINSGLKRAGVAADDLATYSEPEASDMFPETE